MIIALIIGSSLLWGCSALSKWSTHHPARDHLNLIMTTLQIINADIKLFLIIKNICFGLKHHHLISFISNIFFRDLLQVVTYAQPLPAVMHSYDIFVVLWFFKNN